MIVPPCLDGCDHISPCLRNGDIEKITNGVICVCHSGYYGVPRIGYTGNHFIDFLLDLLRRNVPAGYAIVEACNHLRTGIEQQFSPLRTVFYNRIDE